VAKKKRQYGTVYTVRVVFAGTHEEGRKALAEARRYAFARGLERMRREKGERIC